MVYNRQTLEMKKALSIFGIAFMFVGFCSFTSEPEEKEVAITIEADSDGPTCVTTYNCTINLYHTGGTNYKIQVHNYNKQRVTVVWDAMGYNADGNLVKVGGGNIT